MKYFFLMMLVLATGNIQASQSSAGFGGSGSGVDPVSFMNDATDSGTVGGNNTDSGTVGGSNTDSGFTGGPGGYDSGTVGGGGFQPGAGIGKPVPTIGGFVGWFIELINYLVWALLTASLLFFLYGIFTLMFVQGTNEESRSKGKKFMLWGIISLFVMVSVWGLVALLKNSLFGNGPLVGPTFKI
jgi:Type IV secretion system pilin